jgi:hypothetical protein
MGHIGVKGLRHAVEGVDFDDSNLPSCSICARANIKRKPFPSQASHRASTPLQRIHSDICGPLPSCYGGYKYFILFICCYSRYISLYFMRSREEAPQHLHDFRTLAENFCGTKIKILRVDNAPELIKGKSQTYCTNAGISYEKTVPDSPSQNGVAERCNLTLASMARALLIDADLSDWFWPFAIQTAIHIKNCVPHSSLPPHKTPFELWHGYKPNLSHIQPFGSPCTSRILSNALAKFDPRGKPGHLLGYASDAKGYLIWVQGPHGRGGAVRTRRNVTFHDFPSTLPAPPTHNDFSPLWDDAFATSRTTLRDTSGHLPVPSQEYVRAVAPTPFRR